MANYPDSAGQLKITIRHNPTYINHFGLNSIWGAIWGLDRKEAIFIPSSFLHYQVARYNGARLFGHTARTIGFFLSPFKCRKKLFFFLCYCLNAKNTYEKRLKHGP